MESFGVTRIIVRVIRAAEGLYQAILPVTSSKSLPSLAAAPGSSVLSTTIVRVNPPGQWSQPGELLSPAAVSLAAPLCLREDQTIVRVLAAVYLVGPLHWSTPWHNLHLQRSGQLITRTIVHRAPAAALQRLQMAAVLQSGYKEIFFNLVVDMDAIIAYSIYIN